MHKHGMFQFVFMMKLRIVDMKYTNSTNVYLANCTGMILKYHMFK